ncbi:MAG: ribosome assembly RNA-binding protein YhbY [Zoogloeaceae bacterium]|jgi:putative YhbY family RNA-binding protein|nr:ribosome assembly RNA-binding protein YhbY [Zoogloeaceae bacterium]
MLSISSAERRQLRAQAHSLSPVVSIARQGLSETVLKEIDRSLQAHGLIKIRVYNDDREEREACLATICATLAAAPVQHIGKLLVVWRPSEEKKPAAKKPERRSKRSYQNQD